VSAYETFVPVNLLTGFLGSGKTTLLQRLLAAPQMDGTAVLINEFGEVGLDHLLLEHLDEETVILQSGCVCCTIRDDLSRAIRELLDKAEKGTIPPFDRLVIETTGLADPTPVVSTLMADPVLRHHVRLGNVVTTVDALNAERHLAENPESVKQVAVADRLVLTKTDICDEDTAARARAVLKPLNPSAPLIEAASDEIDPDLLLGHDLVEPRSKSAEVQRWLSRDALSAHSHGSETDPNRHDLNRHDRGIQAFALTFDKPLDWTAFGFWLTMLLHAHGDRVLRVKGILNVPDMETPVVIHGVQQVVHPPIHLERWPDADRRSRLVFIVRDLDRALIERSLATFNRLAKPGRRAA